MNDPRGCKPEIHYPCRWQYRLIGEDRSAMLAAVAQAIELSSCRIDEGNISSGGRYLSLKVEITVRDESERLRYYRLFSDNSAIRVVL